MIRVRAYYTHALIGPKAPVPESSPLVAALSRSMASGLSAAGGLRAHLRHHPLGNLPRPPLHATPPSAAAIQLPWDARPRQAPTHPKGEHLYDSV